MRGLEDKIAIVTGGGGGIGREICLRLAAAGCHVAVLDLDAGTAGATAEAVEAASRRALARSVDISDHGAVVEAVGAVRAEFGGIDVLVNNAGWDRGMPFLETEPSFWDRVVAVSYLPYPTFPPPPRSFSPSCY